MMGPADILAFDRRRVAIHEVGHAIVAAHWTTNLSVMLFPTPGYTGRIDQRSVTGQLRYRRFDSKLGLSTVGWAGLIAERLDSAEGAYLPEIIEEYEHDANAVSDTDRAAICAAAHRNRRRTATMAETILRAEWNTLLQLATNAIVELEKYGHTTIHFSNAQPQRVNRIHSRPALASISTQRSP